MLNLACLTACIGLLESSLASDAADFFKTFFSETIADVQIDPDMAVVLFVIAAVLSVAGVVCSVIPHVPGSLMSLVSTAIVTAIHPSWFMVLMLLFVAVLLILVQVLDYIMPGLMAKAGGGGKLSMALATVGLFVGFMVGTIGIPVLGNVSGAIVGPFVGGFVGAFFETKAWKSWAAVGTSFKVAFYTMLSIFAGKLARLLLCLMMLGACITCCIIHYITK